MSDEHSGTVSDKISRRFGLADSLKKENVSCIEKLRLYREFSEAVSHHNRLLMRQLDAVLRDESFPFEDQIAAAAERREEIKYAILAHTAEHGC